MNKPDDNERRVLWSLINCMSKAEKQLFLRKFKTLHTDKSYPLYVKLFEWICKRDKPDIQMLLKDLGPELTLKNICYTRHYLQNRIMELLGQVEEKKEEQSGLIHNVPVIRILFQRGQHKMAIRLWKQTLRIARKFEDFVLIKLLKDEYLHFEMYYSHGNSYAELLRIYNDRIVENEKYFQIIQLEELCFQTILIRKKAHFDLNTATKKQLQNLANHPLLQKRPETTLFSLYHFWSLTNGTIRYLQSDFEAALAYLNPLLTQWHNRPKHISYRPETYLEALYTYTYAAMHLRPFREIEALYYHPANKNIKDSYNYSYFTVLKHLTFLKICHKQGDYTRVANLLHKLKPFINEWKEQLQSDLQRPLLMSVAISYFVLGELNEADAYTRQTLLLFNSHMRPDQARVVHLFLLLVSYEMKDAWVFQNQFKACYQYLYRNKVLSAFEKEIMSLLKKTFPYRRNNKTLQILKMALIHLNNNNTKIKKNICHIFNFPGWIASRIEGVTYQDWVQEQQQIPFPLLY